MLAKDSPIGDSSNRNAPIDAQGDEPEPEQPPAVHQPNRPPEIEGMAATSVVVGDSYRFLPTATDPDPEDVLEFHIDNQPAWAVFDSSTGTLSGSPAGADVGTTSDIVISVTDGEVSTELPAFDLTVVEVTPGRITLNWDPPLFNEDGSPVDDLAGYKVYLGTDPGALSLETSVSQPGITTAVIEDLVPDTYWLAVSAIDLAGNESEMSSPVSKSIEEQ